MKLQTVAIKSSLMLGLLLFMSLFGVACAKKGGDPVPPPPAGTDVPQPPTPSGSGDDRGEGWDLGAVTPLTIDSKTALTYYVATHPVNDPKDIQISVKLTNVGSTVDGYNITPGQVFISYKDNNQYYTGRFYAMDKKNPTGDLATSGTYYPGWHHAAYNTWFVDPRTKQRAFHGFYQDQNGAVMLIIDQVEDEGDGGGAISGSGSIWFKNFANSQYDECGNYRGPSSWYMGSSTCQSLWVVPSWFRLNGPYDTRTFLENGLGGLGNIVTTSVLYPNESKYYGTNNPYIDKSDPARGWRRLGTFNGLDLAKAFSR